MALSSADTPTAIIGQLERFTCALARRESAHGLNPAQWAALRYIAHPGSEMELPTISGFARLRMTTLSSASQTVSSLVRAGLVTRAAAPDKRQRPLQITAEGQLLLKRDPLRHLGTLIAGLSSKSLVEFSEVLDVVMRGLIV
jgi:DNA-binding MarR family transcriptional regulator